MRAYDKGRDLEAVKRIWREIGWATGREDEALVEVFHDAGRTLVQEQAGAAEAAVHVSKGWLRLHETDLELAAVTAVATSHVARRRGHARRMTARMLAEEAGDGAEIAALGIFDQGFYDQLGFGTGPYEVRLLFDPATLTVPVPDRPPVRVTPDDWQDVFTCMQSRRRTHGAAALDEPTILKAELGWQPEPFGLGFRDTTGELTHFVFGHAKGEHGPYSVRWVAYRDTSQLLELLGALRSLADQVHQVRMLEPPEVQLQDLLREPFREGRKGTHGGFHQAAAWWQARALDLAACVEACTTTADDVRFNLDLHDPAVAHLPDGFAWPGTAGKFVVTLGRESSCEPGRADDLPTLSSGVGPFTRLLLGVRGASALAAGTDLDGPPELLAALDRAVNLPKPHLGWDF